MKREDFQIQLKFSAFRDIAPLSPQVPVNQNSFVSIWAFDPLEGICQNDSYNLYSVNVKTYLINCYKYTNDYS